MVWSCKTCQEDEGQGSRLHCRCGAVCSRAVKAAMREAERAAEAEKAELLQISERLIETPMVRHFLLSFEEQDDACGWF